MFTSITSAVTRQAGSVLGSETGLLGSSTVNPILCCPAIAAVVATSAAKAAIADAGNSVGDGSADSGSSDDTAVAQTTYAAAYIAPGRLTATSVPVSDNASVEELIGARRR